MKKTIFIIIFAILLTLTASASPETDAKDIMDKYDSSNAIEKAVENNDLSDLYKVLKESITSKISILKNAAYLIGVTVILTVLKLLGVGSSSETVNIASISAVAGITLIPGINAVGAVSEYLSIMSGFLTSFTPVFAGVMAASGKVVTASTSAYIVLGFSSVASAAAGVIVIPLISLYLCLSLVSGLQNNNSLVPFSESVKKAVNLLLGLLLVLFSGLLSVKMLISGVGDSVTLRGVKFAVSSFVPIIGSALGEAVAAAGSYVGVLSKTFGIFGILALIVFFLPVAAEILLWILTLTVSSSVADLLGNDKISKVFGSVRTAFSVLWSITVCFFLMSIISVGLMLTLGG